jgi:thymidylate synthase (FAD)
VSQLPEMELRECRLQDAKNRQNSIETNDLSLIGNFYALQNDIWVRARDAYCTALDMGIAKEQARALLPEGLTPSRLYMNGTMRSWIHYLKQRLDPSTQKEHRLIAKQVLAELRVVAPVTMGAFFPTGDA